MSRVLLLLVLIGCSDKQLAKLEGIRDEVCACKTPACAQAAMAKVPQGKIASTPKMQQVARDMMDCVAKLNASDRPDPEAEPAAPTSPGSVDPASAGTP